VNISKKNTTNHLFAKEEAILTRPQKAKYLLSMINAGVTYSAFGKRLMIS